MFSRAEQKIYISLLYLTNNIDQWYWVDVADILKKMTKNIIYFKQNYRWQKLKLCTFFATSFFALNVPLWNGSSAVHPFLLNLLLKLVALCLEKIVKVLAGLQVCSSPYRILYLLSQEGTKKNGVIVVANYTHQLILLSYCVLDFWGKMYEFYRLHYFADFWILCTY